MQTAQAPKAQDFDVKPGDIYSLGMRHRLMCGDATSKEDVKRLFDGRKPTLVVTSPPYAKQRDYDRPIVCWDSLMLGALNGHNFADDVQMLINLGVVHTKGEWMPYWSTWLEQMRANRWQVTSQYIWDKIKPPFGENQGRCRAGHEYIFHLRKLKVLLNETVANSTAGKINKGKNTKDPNGSNRKLCTPGPTKPKRPPTSIFRCMPAFDNRTAHPAVFPIALAAQLLSAWAKSGAACYDPFLGSGTTILAAKKENIEGFGMEISPAYCQIALARWTKAYPDQLIMKVATAP